MLIFAQFNELLYGVELLHLALMETGKRQLKISCFTSTRTNCLERSIFPATIPCLVKAEFISWSGIAHGTSLRSTA